MATIDWTPVEEAEAEGTLAGHKVALLEAAKLLAQRLRDERIPGHTLAERVAAARWHFTRPDDVAKGVAYVETLHEGQTGALTKTKAKEYLQAFRQGVADLSDLAQARDSFPAQVKVYLGLLRSKQRWLLRALLGFGLAFVLVLFFADTAPGQVLVTGTVSLVHLLFGWIIGLLVMLVVILVVVVGTAVFLDRRTGGGRIKEEDE